jgi:hypothetical protein
MSLTSLNDISVGVFVQTPQVVLYSRSLGSVDQSAQAYQILCARSDWSSLPFWDCPVTAKALGTWIGVRKSAVYNVLALLKTLGLARQLSARVVRVANPTKLTMVHLIALWPRCLSARQTEILTEMVGSGIIPEEVRAALADPTTKPWEGCTSTESMLFRAQISTTVELALVDTTQKEQTDFPPGWKKRVEIVHHGGLKKTSKRHVCTGSLRGLRSPQKESPYFFPYLPASRSARAGDNVEPFEEMTEMEDVTKKLAEAIKKGKAKEDKARKGALAKKPVLELPTPRKKSTRAPRVLDAEAAGSWSETEWLRFVLQCSMRAGDARVPLWFDDAGNHSVTTARIYGARTMADLTRQKPLTAPLMKFVSLLTEALFEKDTPEGRVHVAKFFRSHLVSRWESFRLHYLGAGVSAANLPFNPTYLTRALSKVVQYYREHTSITPPPLTPNLPASEDTKLEWT